LNLNKTHGQIRVGHLATNCRLEWRVVPRSYRPGWLQPRWYRSPREAYSSTGRAGLHVTVPRQYRSCPSLYRPEATIGTSLIETPCGTTLCCRVVDTWARAHTATPGFKAKTRCSSYVCRWSSCHTNGQNVSIENQCLYYIVSYNKNFLQVQKGLNGGMDTILPQADDRGFRTPRRGLHHRTPHLLSGRA
jgi:hypothetical protein